VSRFLFVVPPLAGHVNPTIGVAKALTERGHTVAWTGSEFALRPMLGPDATVYPTGSRIHREQADRGLPSVKSLWERFVVPFTRFTLPAVEKAVAAYEPDVLVVDQHAPAGAFVAHRNGLPWATAISQGIELTRPFAAYPKIESWFTEQLVGLWTDAGFEPADFIDPRFSPHLTIAYTTEALTGPLPYPASVTERIAMVGPSLAQRPVDAGFSLPDTAFGRQKVLVSMGTLAAGVADDFYQRALAALEPLGDRVFGIVVAAPDRLPKPPPHVLVTPRVPMLQLMPQLDALVVHGGMNTATEALAHGIPLVVAPIRHDQPVIASQVAAAGAGIRVPFARVSPQRLREAILTVLDDPAYRAAAATVRASFTAAGGAPAAAAHLIRLAEDTTTETAHPSHEPAFGAAR
jgi:UDP:flavonoid glycosyltransferase YjiC (YdhE family)